jgi:hypothetical protein
MLKGEPDHWSNPGRRVLRMMPSQKTGLAR